MLERVKGSIDDPAIKSKKEAADRSRRADQDDEEGVLLLVDGAGSDGGGIWDMHGVFFFFGGERTSWQYFVNRKLLKKAIHYSSLQSASDHLTWALHFNP